MILAFFLLYPLCSPSPITPVICFTEGMNQSFTPSMKCAYISRICNSCTGSNISLHHNSACVSVVELTVRGDVNSCTRHKGTPTSRRRHRERSKICSLFLSPSPTTRRSLQWRSSNRTKSLMTTRSDHWSIARSTNVAVAAMLGHAEGLFFWVRDELNLNWLCYVIWIRVAARISYGTE
jgi:hypothetical protein